ncbi:CDPK-related kinase 5-like protein [Drosera capensis]
MYEVQVLLLLWLSGGAVKNLYSKTKVDPAKDGIYVKAKRLSKKVFTDFPMSMPDGLVPWVLCYYNWTWRLSSFFFQGTTKDLSPISEIQLYSLYLRFKIDEVPLWTRPGFELFFRVGHALHDMLISYKLKQLKQVTVDINYSKMPFIIPCRRHKMEVQNEGDVLSKIHHPNVIALLGYCIHGKTRFLVYELMEQGSLENRLHGNIWLWNLLLENGKKSKSSASSKQLDHGAVRSQNTEDSQESLIEHISELLGPTTSHLCNSEMFLALSNTELMLLREVMLMQQQLSYVRVTESGVVSGMGWEHQWSRTLVLMEVIVNSGEEPVDEASTGPGASFMKKNMNSSCEEVAQAVERQLLMVKRLRATGSNFLFASKDEYSQLKAIDFRMSHFVKPAFDELSWPSLSSETKDFVRRMLNKDPGKRITAAQALGKSYKQVKVPLDILIFKPMKIYLCSSSLRRAALRALSKTLTVDELCYVKERYAHTEAVKLTKLTISRLILSIFSSPLLLAPVGACENDHTVHTFAALFFARFSNGCSMFFNPCHV